MADHSRAHIHAPATAGERLADAVAGGMGSWRFIIAQSVLVVVWMAANVWLLSRPFDPFPFILLNLAFSTQAAYAAPLIQMSQNRQAQKDRLRDDTEAVEVHYLARINRQQLVLLVGIPVAAALWLAFSRAQRRYASPRRRVGPPTSSHVPASVRR